MSVVTPPPPNQHPGYVSVVIQTRGDGNFQNDFQQHLPKIQTPPRQPVQPHQQRGQQHPVPHQQQLQYQGHNPSVGMQPDRPDATTTANVTR